MSHARIYYIRYRNSTASLVAILYVELFIIPDLNWLLFCTDAISYTSTFYDLPLLPWSPVQFRCGANAASLIDCSLTPTSCSPVSSVGIRCSGMYIITASLHVNM